MAETNSNSVKPRRGRRWLRFSLRTLLVLMTITAVWLGLGMKRIRDRHEAIETMRSMEGRVIFENAANGPTPFVDAEAGPGSPDWLRNLLGVYGKHAGSRVDLIWLKWPKGPTEAKSLLRSIAALSEVKTLSLQLHIDDHRLASLPELRYLQSLSISNMDGIVTEKGLQCLNRMPQLKQLQVSRATIAAAGYRLIAGRSKLRIVTFLGCELSADGLDQLAVLQDLFLLELNGSKIGDESVAYLGQLRGLKELSVQGTNFTRNGVEALRVALPNTGIQSDFGTSPPIGR